MFYHLGDLDDALTYALGAGSLFDVNGSSEYVQTILGERGLPRSTFRRESASKLGHRCRLHASCNRSVVRKTCKPCLLTFS